MLELRVVTQLLDFVQQEVCHSRECPGQSEIDGLGGPSYEEIGDAGEYPKRTGRQGDKPRGVS